MPLRLQYCLICEDARIGLNNTVDFLGVFDRIWAKAVPTVHSRLAFVCHLVADSEDDTGKHKVTVVLTTPDGRPVLQQEGELTAKPEGGAWLTSARLVMKFDGFPLESYGKYLFTVRVRGEVVATHPLAVTKPPKP